MNTNKIVIYLTIVAICLIVAIPTVIKVVNENNRKLNLVNEKLVTEKARECIYDGVCKENKITLKTLYTNLYLKDKIINPKDKTVYNEQSYIIVNEKEATFFPVK